MATLRISGDTSGYIDLRAPTTGAANVFTFPATTGTILTDATTSGINASAISVGTLGKSRLPTGSVLQVVQSSKFNGLSTTSTSVQFSDSIPSITPTSASSKLMLLWSPSVVVDTDNDAAGNNNSYIQFEYQIGGTGGSWTLLEAVNIPSRGGNGSFTHACQLISPATTSVVYFRVGIAKNEGSRSVVMNNSWGSNRLTILEIAA